MTDRLTEVTSRSWIGRLLESIKTVLFGLLLFVLAFIVLFWNEGRAVKTAQSLSQGAHDVIDVDPAAVNPANDAKLVHFSGTAKTADTLHDDTFQISLSALKLLRQVEMYQWIEDKKTDTQKNLGGGDQTTTTYSYTKQWSAQWHDSTRFKEAGHVNPPMAVQSQTISATKVTVGAFTLSPGLTAAISASQPLDLPADAPATLPGGFKKVSAGYYLGASPDDPAVGDLRVRFAAVMPQDVSVIAQQNGATLRPYQTQPGGTVEMLEPGTKSAADMFQEAQTRNTHLTWILRGAGFLAMWFGLMMVLNPFKVLADVIPFFGTLVGAGLALVALCVALPLSLLTIAVAWFVFRPLLSLGLIAGAVAAVVVILLILRQRKPQATPAPAV